MPAPASATYSGAAKVAAHQAFVNLIDAGTAGSLKIKSSTDVLLAQLTLNKPCGTVNGTTGQLTFNVTSVQDTSADNSGTAAYGEFCDSAGTAHLSLPAVAGTAPTNGYLVLNSLNILAGGPVILLSAVIG